MGTYFTNIESWCQGEPMGAYFTHMGIWKGFGVNVNLNRSCAINTN